MSARSFLFLQGPISPFFSRIAHALVSKGHKAYGINLSIGDQMFWRGPNPTNYRGRLKDWPAYIEGFMDRHGITDLVLLGEQREYHKIAIQAAKQRGIRVTVTDFGYLRPDWITLEKDGMSAHSLFPRTPEAIRELAARCPKADFSRQYQDSFWTMALWDMTYHFANYFLWWLFPHYQTHKRDNPILVYLGTGLRLFMSRWKNPAATARLRALNKASTPFFVFPLQMENDFQIRAYSPYPDMSTPIAEVLRSFAIHAPADTHLLVKVHPWDPGLKNWGKIVNRLAAESGAAERIHYVDGGSLDAMCQTAKGMVTINSTSGLSALKFDCPVMTLGEAIYDVPGLTHQGPLDEFWCQAKQPDAALRDAYLNAMAATIQIRGVFYNQPGLDAGVDAATKRLHDLMINEPIDV
jgi:capsular polysaccharide export protein